MNEIIGKEGMNCLTEVIKSANIKITLEQWPCAIAVMGLCATVAFISWINRPVVKSDYNMTS